MCECKYRLSENLCNSNQKWNHDECRCGCKEIDSFCKFDYIWNPFACDCECDKAGGIGEYLDIKNCACKKRHFGKL